MTAEGGSSGLSAEQRQTLAAGRLWAARALPYLASAVLALRPVVVDRPRPGWDLSCYPADTGWHIYVTAESLSRSTPAEVGFWHLHQVGHLLRRHEQRCPLPEGATPNPDTGRTDEQRAWNEGCDAEVNDDLAADLSRGGPPLPPRALQPHHLHAEKGQLAEAYFRARTARPGAKADRSEGFASECGSGVDGVGRPWECASPGLSPLERQLLAADTARRIRESSRTRGDTPAGWKRWADEVLSPTVDWRRQLALAVRRGLAVTSGRVDYSYSRPSRRAGAAPEIVLPTMRRPAPKVAVVVDTSGSMSDAMLGQALAEVGGLLRRVGVCSGHDAVRLLSCDAQAYEAKRVLDVRDVQLLGGGGTDMAAGIDAAAALRPRPDLVIVLTDGHTPWPSEAPPACRVVVALLDPQGSSPSWASRIVVDPVTSEPSPRGASR